MMGGMMGMMGMLGVMFVEGEKIDDQEMKNTRVGKGDRPLLPSYIGLCRARANTDRGERSALAVKK
jgi:hypothetical protein